MKKLTHLLGALIMLALPIQLMADNYDKYYQNLPCQMTRPTLPVIPGNNVSVTDFGGVGDGITLNTEAFRKAMSALDKQGGGHLNVPAGVWLTGPIAFKNNVDLHLEKNAIILFSADKRLYLDIDKATGKILGKLKPALNASKRKNISITGQGIIDGNGKWWRPVKRSKVSDTEWSQFKAMGGTETEQGKLWFPFNLKNYKNVTATPEKEEKLRADLVRFTECENILIQGVTFQNSPRFHVHPVRCKHLVVDGITILCPWNAQNGDGLDLSNCQNSLIVNNTVNVGDDGICMKGGVGQAGVEAGPCENILIENNTVYHAHGGFVIGSDVSGGIKNIVVRNNRFCGTDIGLRFKSSIERGGKTENIFISNIYMTDIIGEAISFETTYADKGYSVSKDGNEKNAQPVKAPFSPDFGNMHISNIVCHGTESGIVAHGAEGMVHDIVIENSTIFYTKKATDIDAACDVKLNNVRLLTY